MSGTDVLYKVNGSTLYTSTTAPSYPLYVTGSLFSNGGVIGDVTLSGDNLVDV